MRKTNNTSLYVHIPFCYRKCFYCSFSIVVGQQDRAGLYLKALAKEAERYKGKKLRSIYIGGGTPSYLSVDELDFLCRMVAGTFQWDKDIEYTFEVNPEDVCPDKMKILRAHGINRISLGIQTFNDAYLKYLGRNHGVPAVYRSLDCLRSIGFDNVSVDLMYSFPEQSLQDIKNDVEAVIGLQTEHISIYALTIEHPSRFFARKVVLDKEEKRAEDFLVVREMLNKAGWNQYEISNFARESFESAHNLNYWNIGDYIGLGVSAHSHQAGKRWWNVSKFMDYLKKTEQGSSVIAGEEVLTAEQQFMESVLFGLRMTKGVHIPGLEERFGACFNSRQKNVLDNLLKNNFLLYNDGVLKAQPQGQLVLDEISAQLI